MKILISGAGIAGLSAAYWLTQFGFEVDIMAMAGAYILAQSLNEANGNYVKAFKQTETIMKPSIKTKQKEAEKFIRSFVPNTRFGLTCRNWVTKVISIPFVAKTLFKGLMNEELIIT